MERFVLWLADNSFYDRLAQEISLETGTLLDVGCGPCILLNFLGRYKPRVQSIGLDPSQRILQRFGTLAKGQDKIVGIGERLPFRSCSVDVCLCTSTLDYAISPWEMVEEIHRVLKPKGRLYILTNLYLVPLSERHVRTTGHVTPINHRVLSRLLKHFQVQEFTPIFGGSTLRRIVKKVIWKLFHWSPSGVKVVALKPN